jgi:hypothetical protein
VGATLSSVDCVVVVENSFSRLKHERYSESGKKLVAVYAVGFSFALETKRKVSSPTVTAVFEILELFVLSWFCCIVIELSLFPAGRSTCCGVGFGDTNNGDGMIA